jgi:hypothetical protein
MIQMPALLIEFWRHDETESLNTASALEIAVDLAGAVTTLLSSSAHPDLQSGNG